MKKYKKIIFFIFLVLLYILSSFLNIYLSLETGAESIKTSDAVGDIIKDSIETVTKEPPKDSVFFLYIREIIGHFLLFVLNSFIGYFVAIYIFKLNWKKNMFAMLISGNLAIFVELSQRSISGRYFDIKDIVINFIGVIIGLILANLIFFLIKLRIKINNNNEKKLL